MAKLVPQPQAILRNEARFLLSAPSAVAQEFAKITVNIILKGDVAARGYAKAAKALQVTVDAVDQGVKMLYDIFIIGSQSNFSPAEMIKYLQELGFHSETGECLAAYFTEQLHEIRRLVAVPRLNVPSYRKLEWRLDVQLASRSLLNQAEPSFLLKLSLNPVHVGGMPILTNRKSQSKVQIGERAEKEDILMEANYATLKKICNQLEQALAERRSRHSRRILLQLQYLEIRQATLQCLQLEFDGSLKLLSFLSRQDSSSSTMRRGTFLLEHPRKLNNPVCRGFVLKFVELCFA